MLHNQNFSIEELEARLETFCIYVPYLGVCYKKVWFVTIPYPCWKLKLVCF
jgi:hypothetical protein